MSDKSYSPSISRSPSPSLSRSNSRSPTPTRKKEEENKEEPTAAVENTTANKEETTTKPQEEESTTKTEPEPQKNEQKQQDPEKQNDELQSPSASPVREQTQEKDESVPDEAEQLLLYVRSRNIQGVKNILGVKEEEEPKEEEADKKDSDSDEEEEKEAKKTTEETCDDIARVEHLLTTQHTDGGGNIIYIAAHENYRDSLGLIADEFPNLFSQLVKPVAVKMLQFQRYPMVLFLASLDHGIIQEPVNDHGHHLLHCVCTRRRPNVDFVKQLLAQFGVTTRGKDGKIDLNEQDDKGYTPLHLVAIHSSGIEGRDVAKMLLKHGADDEALSFDEKTPATVAVNPFVRSILGVTGGVKERSIPKVDDKSKEQIDACKDSSQFPALKDYGAEIAAMTAAQNQADEERTSPKKKTKKISAEASEAMVHRLYQQSLEKKERWLDSQMSRISEFDKSHGKIVSGEEVEAAVERLYDQELASREEKKETVTGKYLRELPKGPELTKEEIDSSANRLCKGSMEHKAKSRENLEQKYAPPKEERKLTKAELEASAGRLHDECNAKTKEKYDSLYQTYMPEPEKKKLKKSQQQEMADRLSAPIKH